MADEIFAYCALFVVAVWALSEGMIRILHRVDQRDLERAADEAADWDEPTREDIEWWLLIAAVENEIPHPATIAHVAKWEAEGLDQEWFEMNRGGAA